jgi:hypothetical protein
MLSLLFCIFNMSSHIPLCVPFFSHHTKFDMLNPFLSHLVHLFPIPILFVSIILQWTMVRTNVSLQPNQPKNAYQTSLSIMTLQKWTWTTQTSIKPKTLNKSWFISILANNYNSCKIYYDFLSLVLIKIFHHHQHEKNTLCASNTSLNEYFVDLWMPLIMILLHMQ